MSLPIAPTPQLQMRPLDGQAGVSLARQLLLWLLLPLSCSLSFRAQRLCCRMF